MESNNNQGYCLGKWIVREDWWLWLLFALALVVGAVIYPSMPDTIPTHWGIDGKPNGWSHKAVGVFGIIGIFIGAYLILLFVPLIDPRRRNYTRFLPTLRILRSLVVVFCLIIWGIALSAARGAHVIGLVPVFVAVLYIFLGNLMGRIKRNWFIGIRTPWTLDNDEVWRLTHRMGGRVMVAGGLFCLAGAVIGGNVAPWAMVIGILGTALFCIVYSYFAWRRIRTGSRPGDGNGE